MGVLYPSSINGQRVNTLQLFCCWEYLLVIGHALGQHNAGGLSLPVFEVLKVAAADGRPDAPRGRGLVNLKLFGYSPVRRMVLTPSIDHVLDGLYRLADCLRYGRLYAFGYQAGDEIADMGIVSECCHDAALGVPLACFLVEDGMGLDEAEDYREVAAQPNRRIAHLLRQAASVGDYHAMLCAVEPRL